MKKNNIITFIMVLFCAINCYVLNACEKKIDYVAVGIEKAKNYLDKGEYLYEDVVAENPHHIPGYSHTIYDLFIVLNEERDSDYKTMLSMLKYLSSSSYNSESFSEGKIVFMEYIKCGEYVYSVNSTNEFILERKLAVADESSDNSTSAIYNSIAIKNGNNLTQKEKAWLYKELNYYLTAQSNGKYIYSEEEAFKIVAEKYSVTIEFLKKQIWIPDMHDDYVYYFGRK